MRADKRLNNKPKRAGFASVEIAYRPEKWQDFVPAHSKTK